MPRSSDDIAENGQQEKAVVIRQPGDNQVVIIEHHQQWLNQNIADLEAGRALSNKHTVQLSVQVSAVIYRTYSSRVPQEK